jgi:hypothetical protein
MEERSCSPFDCPSLHWMQMISGQFIFYQILPYVGWYKESPLKKVTVKMFLLLPTSRRQSSSQQLATSPTHFKITYYNFLTKILLKLNMFYEFVFHC